MALMDGASNARKRHSLGLWLPGRSLQRSPLRGGACGHRPGWSYSADVIQSHWCCCPGRGGPTGGGGELHLPPSPSSTKTPELPKVLQQSPWHLWGGEGVPCSHHRSSSKRTSLEKLGYGPNGPKLVKKFFLKETSWV